MRILPLFSSALTSAWLVIGSPALQAADQQQAPAAPESLRPVVTELETLATQVDGAVARALRAHRDLASNRTNSSLIAFLDMDDSARAQWLLWTERRGCTAERAAALSCYLLGDARARQGDWDGAVAAFGASLAGDPDFVLSRVARGMLHTSAGHPDDALSDLEHAIAAAPTLAEAHLALGALLLHRGVARGAREAFDSAQAYAPGSLAVLNGLGCTSFADQDWDGAEARFRLLGELLDLPIAKSNMQALMAGAEGYLVAQGARSPMFHRDHFGDWEALRNDSLDPRSVVRLFLQGALPPRLDDEAVAAFNRALGDRGFIRRLEQADHIRIVPGAEPRLHRIETRGALEALSLPLPEGWLATLRVNRAILEAFYPGLMRSHEGRGPGSYISGSFSKIHEQKNISQSFGDHTFHDQSRFDQIGGSATLITPGGVTTESAQVVTDAGDWPVWAFTGLAYGLGTLANDGGRP